MTIVILTVVLFAFFLLASIPLAFSLGIASVIGILLQGKVPLIVIAQKAFSGIDSFLLLSIPWFILAGMLMDQAGISHALVNLAQSLVGFFRGGLAMVVILSEMLFSGVSGAVTADTAAIGSLLVPPMVKAGYSRERSTAILSAACGMGILVPPCIQMIVYGGLTGVSIGALFVAGFIPAAIMALALMIQVYIQARRLKLPTMGRPSLRLVGRSAFQSIPAAIMALIIFGGILGGIFTPTEAAVVAVVYGFLVGFLFYRRISIKGALRMVIGTARITGIIMLLVITASLFGWYLTTEQVPQAIAKFLSSLPGGKYIFLFSANVIFLFIGSVLEGIPALIMMVPILLPAAQKVGVDPLHLGVVLIANLGVGFFLPPVGLGLNVACTIGQTTIDRVTRPLLPYLIVMFAVVLLISYIPDIVLLAPRILGL
jgi:C4-dicarboxylate transporter DctM subunit